MSIVKLYFAPALLLILLTCPLWQVGQSSPVRVKGPVTVSCVLSARSLLQDITGTLTQGLQNQKNDLFSGINCTKQSVVLSMDTETASVCAPKGSTCSGITKPDFDQESCLTNIGEDLSYYYRFLAAQAAGSSVLSRLRELMENCFTWSLPADLSLDEAAADRPSTFDERLSLCKELKGFQVRTITISRVLAYMNSGEHTK